MSNQAEGFPAMFAQQVANVTVAENRITTEGCEHCTDPDGNLCFPTYGLAPHRPTEPNGIRGHEFIEPTPEDGFVPDPESPTHGTYYCTHCSHGKPPAEPEVLTLLEMAQRVVSEPDCLARVDYTSWPMAQAIAADYLSQAGARELFQSQAVTISRCGNDVTIQTSSPEDSDTLMAWLESLANQARKPVDYAESTPIPPAIQAKITEILAERGFVRDGKIVRRPAIPKRD